MPSRNLPPPFKAVSIAVVALFAGALLVLAPGRAAAATPCWKAVINDWYDNSRIDGTYPISCYRQALKHLPEDVQDYTSLPDDIRAAMQAALACSSTTWLVPSIPFVAAIPVLPKVSCRRARDRRADQPI